MARARSTQIASGGGGDDAAPLDGELRDGGGDDDDDDYDESEGDDDDESEGGGASTTTARGGASSGGGRTTALAPAVEGGMTRSHYLETYYLGERGLQARSHGGCSRSSPIVVPRRSPVSSVFASRPVAPRQRAGLQARAPSRGWWWVRSSRAPPRRPASAPDTNSDEAGGPRASETGVSV